MLDITNKYENLADDIIRNCEGKLENDTDGFLNCTHCYYGDGFVNVYGGKIFDRIAIYRNYLDAYLMVSVRVNGWEYLLTIDKNMKIKSIFKEKLFINGMYYTVDTLEDTHKDVNFSTFKRAITRFYNRNLR